MTDGINHHCNVVTISGCGILIEGEAGAGKTSLSLGLLEHCCVCGVVGEFVCDDQALLSIRSGNLLAKVPASLAGKVELRGLGIVDIDHVDEARIDLVVRLTDDELIERLPEKETVELLGVELPLLLLPSRHEMMARRIVFGWIDSEFSK